MYKVGPETLKELPIVSLSSQNPKAQFLSTFAHFPVGKLRRWALPQGEVLANPCLNTKGGGAYGHMPG